MGIRILQNSFTGGEMSPSMYGRIDDKGYQTGLATCRNFIVLPQGPVANRPGTEFVRAAKYAGSKCRLIPFQFSADQTMVIELGEKYARFHTDGATLMNGSVPYEIATPYSADDVMGLHYCQSGDIITLVHNNYAPRELRRYGVVDWRLVQIDFSSGVSAPTISNVTYSCGLSGDALTNSGLDASRYAIRYRVTAIKESEDGDMESAASEAKSVQGNLYIDDSTCTITWGAVSGASRYRVYKSYTGVFGYIGETEGTTFLDDNIAADEGITPPRYDTNLFLAANAITSVAVTNGGSGYGTTGEVAVGKVNLYPTFWKKAVKSSNGENYPDYPDFPKITAKILDRKSSAANAKIELSTSHYYTRSYNVTHYEGYDEYTCYAYSKTSVTGITITDAGWGYIEPYIQWYEDGVPVAQELLKVYTSRGKVYTYYDTYKEAHKLPEVSDSQEDCVVLNRVVSQTTLAVSDATGSGAQLQAIISGGKITGVKVLSGGSGYTNPTVYVASTTQGSGATFSATVSKGGDYPAAVTYFEQRRFFGGTVTSPQLILATRPGTERDMSYTIPSLEDNRLKFRINATQASRVSHLVPIQQLLVLTESSVFRINDEVAADNINVKPQTSEGASSVQPAVVNNVVVYVAARGGHVYELGYQYERGGFVAGDLSVRAGHLFETARPVDLARMVAPDPILWLPMSDGTLLGLTYMPDQGVGAWHRHDTIHGAFESATCVTEGDEDMLYLVVRRDINGQSVRYIERMHARRYDNLTEAFYVDCGATYRGAEATVIKGLDYLEGETVNILADGGVQPQQVVTNGQITLDSPASVVHIGLPITAEVETLPIAYPARDGSYGKGHMKNINALWLQVYRSSGLFAGTSGSDLVEIKQRQDEPYGEPPQLVSDELEVALPGDWSHQGKIVLWQEDPLPVQLVGITADLAS